MRQWDFVFEFLYVSILKKHSFPFAADLGDDYISDIRYMNPSFHFVTSDF